MPWGSADAKRHTKKASSGVAQRQWAHVANSVLEGGGSEGSAVRQANGVVAQRGSKASYQEGTDYVPETGPYTLHEGEMVFPQEEARQLRKVLPVISLLTGQPAAEAKPATAPGPAGTSLVKANAPGSRGYDLSVSATNAPRIPATRLTPGEAPDIPAQPAGMEAGAGVPGAPGGRTDANAAIHPAESAGWGGVGAPGMPGTSLARTQPSLPGPPRREDFPAQQLPMWRKALGLIAASAAGPKAGPLAENILRGPEQRAEQKFEQATGEYNAEVLRGRQERADILNRENVESEIAERNARTAALQEPKPEKPEDVVHKFSDALASGNTAEADRLRPAVRDYLETTQKPEAAGKDLDKKIDEYNNAAGRRVEVMQKPDGSTYEVTRQAVQQSSAGPGSTPNDPKDIAAAIIRGEQPPDTKGLYRSTAAVRAELARNGFNLTKAEEDWQATQKYLATLNGAQQTRLRQAVSFTKDGLNQLEDIYNQWQRVGPTSGWKVFNKAALGGAAQLPGEAGALANRLKARLADVTSELGTVYKGGNSSTDESLKLAGQNLSGDWNEQTFRGALKDIRESLVYRENSMRLAPAGVSQGNAYVPPGANAGAGGGGGTVIRYDAQGNRIP